MTGHGLPSRAFVSDLRRIARSVLLALCMLSPAVLMISSCSSPPEMKDDLKPDIVILVIDTWRWDSLSFNSGRTTKPDAPFEKSSPRTTPSLDALAANGLAFSRAYSTSSWTLPSMASILTGQYPSVHGAYGKPKRASALRDEVATLGEVLGGAGYKTAAITNVSFFKPVFGLDRGFSEFDFARATNREMRRAEASLEAASRVLDESNAEQAPLFLLVHLFDPHLAYDPPPPWDTTFTPPSAKPPSKLVNPIVEIRDGTFDPDSLLVEQMKGLYRGEVAYVDEQIGRFLDRLGKRRQVRDSLIVVTADHGEEFRDHGWWEHGHTLHSELTHVPLILSPPKSAVRPTNAEQRLVSLLDIFPTVLEVASLPQPTDLPGRSLLAETGNRSQGVLSERALLDQTAIAYRTDEWTLIVDKHKPAGQLYRATDLAESQGLALEFPQVLASLRSEAEALQETLSSGVVLQPTGDPLPEDVKDQLEHLGYLSESDD